MTNNSAIPRDEPGKLAFIRHLNATLPGFAAILNVSAEQLARLDNGTAWYSFSVDYQTVLKNAAEGASALKAVVRDGPVTGTQTVHPVILPTPPDGPVFEDVFGFIGDLIAYIKRQPTFNDATGQALGVLPLKAPPPDLNNLQPDLRLDFLNSQPNLSWAKNSADALEIEVDRGSGSFALLTIALQTSYLDEFPLPPHGSSALWRYRAIYRVKDKRVGQWSTVLEVAVKGV